MSFPVRFIAVALIALLADPARALDYQLTVPTTAASSLDRTARSLQAAMSEERSAAEVLVHNFPGAAGSIGISQYLKEAGGEPSRILVVNFAMVGAILINYPTVPIREVTPVVRLDGGPVAIVVPANSDITGMARLLATIRADPVSVSWAGGPTGGFGHVAAALFYREVGIDLGNLRFVPFFNSIEGVNAVVTGKLPIGVFPQEAVAEEAAAGRLRIIALSGPGRLPGVHAPSFRDAGIDLVVDDWHMIAAAPGLLSPQVSVISAEIDRIADSPTWRKFLADTGREVSRLSGDALAAQFSRDIDRIGRVLRDLSLHGRPEAVPEVETGTDARGGASR